MGEKWSKGDDARLRAAGRRGPIRSTELAGLAATLDRSISSVRKRASRLRLLTPKPRRPHPTILEASLVDSGQFAAALTTAAALGFEHPPDIVPNLRPGTRCPIRLTPPIERSR
jgi:hypothetical protein